MEVEKNVTRTVEDFEINNQDEVSSATILSSNPSSLLKDSLAGSTGQCKAVQGSVRQCRAGQCRVVQGSAGKCSAGEYRTV